MINVNELMLGNWVTKNGIRFYVTEINAKGVVKCTVSNPDGEVCTVDISGCEGIPLTPEIFEKAGFGMGYDNGHKFFSIDITDKILFYMYEKEGKHGLSVDAPEWRDYPCNDANEAQLFSIQYLHQLQNLYYSLTHTPLKIEL